MSSNSDATPAYRGYRLQSLYALNRILNQQTDDNLIFQPEGKEDLAVFDSKNNLLEIVQVKERTQNLRLSSFEPEKKDSFFYRVAKEIAVHSDIKINIVAFGNVGPEIVEAFQKDGTKRKNVVRKLSTYKKLSEDKCSMLFEKIDLISVDEKELTDSVFFSFAGFVDYCLCGRRVGRFRAEQGRKGDSGNASNNRRGLEQGRP